jgi:hypothetical protein
MSRCHNCQRDPDEYDRHLRKQAKKIEVAEEAAILLGERLERMRQLVADLAEHCSKVAPDSSHWVEDLAPRVDKEMSRD